jgi:hypothetical protein
MLSSLSHSWNPPSRGSGSGRSSPQPQISSQTQPNIYNQIHQPRLQTATCHGRARWAVPYGYLWALEQPTEPDRNGGHERLQRVSSNTTSCWRGAIRMFSSTAFTTRYRGGTPLQRGAMRKASCAVWARAWADGDFGSALMGLGPDGVGRSAHWGLARGPSGAETGAFLSPPTPSNLYQAPDEQKMQTQCQMIDPLDRNSVK